VLALLDLSFGRLKVLNPLTRSTVRLKATAAFFSPLELLPRQVEQALQKAHKAGWYFFRLTHLSLNEDQSTQKLRNLKPGKAPILE